MHHYIEDYHLSRKPSEPFSAQLFAHVETPYQRKLKSGLFLCPMHSNVLGRLRKIRSPISLLLTVSRLRRGTLTVTSKNKTLHRASWRTPFISKSLNSSQNLLHFLQHHLHHLTITNHYQHHIITYYLYNLGNLTVLCAIKITTI